MPRKSVIQLGSPGRRSLPDAKLVIDQVGFHVNSENSRQEPTTVRQLTVLINDIGIAMKRMEYALYRGKIYKKCSTAKFAYSYKCKVKAFINSLEAN